MICYAFPLAHEAHEVLNQCTEKEQFTVEGLQCTLGNFHGRPILVALIGMGPERAAENTRAIFRYFRPKGLVLAGYGGALVPQLKVGQVVLSTNFTSEAVLQFLRLLSGFDYASFCTSNEIVGTPEMRDQYARSTQSQVIDMETSAVADVVAERAIPFIAIRVISDEHSQKLPTGALTNGYNAQENQATPFKLATYLAKHPGEFTPLRKFVAGLSIARKNLTRFLEQLNNELPSSW